MGARWTVLSVLETLRFEGGTHPLLGAMPNYDPPPTFTLCCISSISLEKTLRILTSSAVRPPVTHTVQCPPPLVLGGLIFAVGVGEQEVMPEESPCLFSTGAWAPYI